MNTTLLRSVWQRIFRQAWILTLVLFVVSGGLRAYGLFGPVSARMLVMLNFFLMWFLPFIFLSQAGRCTMGLKRVERPIWWLWGLLFGAGSSLIVFGVGYGLYGHGQENWYVSILNSWAMDKTMLQLPRIQLFLIYTLPAILFSPVGEEFFFRGMVHEAIREHWGSGVATAINVLAFGGVHILHYGLNWDDRGLHFTVVSGTLWILLMMGASWLFTLCRQRSGSIWPAVMAHATFNLVMNVSIFWALL